MVDNSTWAGMIAMNLQVHVSCDRCERLIEIDMGTLPPNGKAIGAKFRCSQCGKPAGMIVSHKSAARAVPNQRQKRK